MSRSKSSSNSRRKKQKIQKLAKGSWGTIKNKVKSTREYMMRALRYSYRDRKMRARFFRRLWICRINAAARTQGVSYSDFLRGLKIANVSLNRKILSELAIHNPDSFRELVAVSKKALESSNAA
ncbi:50S ribosomal protein L20 [Candidatus Riflebacteria bacterium]